MKFNLDKLGFAGIFIGIAILSVACSTTVDLSKRPLYVIDKFRIEDTIERTIFIEQLIVAKVPEPLHNVVFTLDKYIQLGRAVFAFSVHSLLADLPDRDEIIILINEDVLSLKATGPSRIFETGSQELESVHFFLDEDTFTRLRYCDALEIHYGQHAIPIPREGLEAIWNFLKDSY